MRVQAYRAMLVMSWLCPSCNIGTSNIWIVAKKTIRTNRIIDEDALLDGIVLVKVHIITGFEENWIGAGLVEAGEKHERLLRGKQVIGQYLYIRRNVESYVFGRETVYS